ncbi:MAG: UDP-glucuronic acid decarboxylase family protein [Polyangiales bacterium]
MRVLVTGGAGFLGSNLVDRLLAAGHEVVAIDNLQTGSSRNLAHLEGNARFSFVQHDVTQPYDFGPVDRIYNLACAASPPRYQANPIHTTLTCTQGMLHALDLGKKYGARVFQASTSEVYGDPDVHPQPESYRGNVNTIGPRACYDEGKRVAETLCFDHRRMHGTEIRVVRIFNTYGPRMDPEDGRVVSTFVVQALRGEPLTMFGDGQQTRSFCYVDDLLDGFLALMEHATEIGPINIGNPHEFTVRELAELVREMTGTKSEFVHKALPVDDPKQRRPVIDRARTVLGYEPKIQLREGLARTIDYFKRLG